MSADAFWRPVSTPACGIRIGGTAIVLGSAAGSAAELSLARRCEPGAVVVAVNHAASLAPDCDLVVTPHGTRAETFRRIAPRATIHVYGDADGAREIDRLGPWPGADFHWRGPPFVRGTGSLAAVMVAKALGARAAVLCGVPLEPVGYAAGIGAPREELADSEFEPSSANSLQIVQRVEEWRRWRDAGALAGVTSTSGATRRLLGAPEWMGGTGSGAKPDAQCRSDTGMEKRT